MSSGGSALSIISGPIRGISALHEGSQSVKQLDDQRLHWEAEIGGKIKEWDARITDQVPDQLIAWQIQLMRMESYQASMAHILNDIVAAELFAERKRIARKGGFYDLYQTK